ncbi:RNA polymerase sigma factor, sigma-70 family [Pedobacter steynii]|uniref:RNA polymerase sigma factor, sigma-70 family n=1 Tax=Pedobacter steynii TaxID=430522 RepID=A0A1G9KFF5_9SPHI|nr:sigma-70 family RNA polymerase sigma factor [Pedobacter steynii]NQX38535.1 sigma-70 family RNA polymerase sigma factor [Pedobacter steynii]SDL48411.1 RNA polymerase sigma factor, sigma-70 family [Pedobacter steynii]
MFAKQKDENELIARWRNGDEKSFDALFSLHFGKLHQFALRHTNDTGLAEELAMDTMLKVWQQKKQLYQDTMSLGPLLFRILQVSLIDHYRKRKLETIDLEALIVEPQSTENADGRLLANQLQTLYRAGMDSLSPRQKLVFEMRSEREMSYREIAGELELSTKTVDRHLSDAVISIRKHVSKSLTIAGITSLIYHLFL